jgi:hypothetical protein
VSATVVAKDSQYLLNHCARHLARDNTDERHGFFGLYAGELRARISEPWRFPIVDSHDGDEAGAYDWNDVTFVFVPTVTGAPPRIELLATCNALFEPIPLNQVDDAIYWTCTLKLPKAARFRYLFLIDSIPTLDPTNPQVETLPNGELWSSFFTWAYNQPVSFERWEFVLLERLTRHILPFKEPDAENFLKNGANEENVRHLYRLFTSVGVPNYIDNIVAREERHLLYAYKTCLEMIDTVLRLRHPGKEPEFLSISSYERLYTEMADEGAGSSLFVEGWDRNRYGSPHHFLSLLRRHAITGAFSHPKYGGNAGAMAWAYLEERYKADDGATAFNWRQAIEPPLGTSREYRG